MDEGPVQSVVIHAVYLINCASQDSEVRAKSLNSLVHAMQLGDAIGACGVVLHPGSQKQHSLEGSLERIGEAIEHALSESEQCRLLLENTAGAGGTIGRSFSELADLIERSAHDKRVGLCIDCCHLLASGFDIRTEVGLSEAVDDLSQKVGLYRVVCLNINDSKAALGSNRDRHENLPLGELGRAGLCAFLSEPRFEGLPALLEVPGPDGKGPDKQQIDTAKQLRRQGLTDRG
jgi:deoxyribonuclease-4